jgi:hypothetical protein
MAACEGKAMSLVSQMCDDLISAYIMIEVLFTALMLAFQLPPFESSLSDVAREFEARPLRNYTMDMH